MVSKNYTSVAFKRTCVPRLHICPDYDIVSALGDCLNDTTFSSVSENNVLIKGLQKILLLLPPKDTRSQ